MMASQMMAPSAPGAPVQPDPAAERAKAEADAANTANQSTATDKRARRANVLGTGGSTDALGQGQSAITPTPKTTALGGGAVG